MKELLTDKVVLVSGGTQGVGAGGRPGRRPGGRDRRRHRPRREPGEAVAAELEAAGATARFVQADVADVAQARAAVAATVDEHGPDRLPGQRGRADHPRHPAGHHPGAVRPAHRGQPAGTVLPDAGRGRRHDGRARRPARSSTSSPSTPHGGQPYLAPYVAAKAGLAGLTRNAAHAHRWDRIRINGLEHRLDRPPRARTPPSATFHAADDDWQQQAARGPADGQARPGRRDRRLRGVPALRPQRRRHRVGHRLGPERLRRPRD